MRRCKTATLAIVVLSGLVAPAVRADTTEEDLAKYWRLRQRLITDFASVGPEPGQSQPAPDRHAGQGWMHWGDGTIALGFYTGVLATEYYMLAHPERFPGADEGDGGRLDRALDELYYALYALERLDLIADASFPEPCTVEPLLNGFFIRDDVPADFYQHFPGINQVTSDFTDPSLTNKEESQDQVFHVQTGLALVIKLVPADVVVQGQALRSWAVAQAQRITLHFAHDDWLIRNPACGNRPVDRGDNVIAYSYGESLAIGFLTDGVVTPSTDDLWEAVWNTLQSPENPAYGNVNNLHMALAIMAIGDGFGPDTAAIMAELSALQDWPLYPIMHRVLHGSDATGFCETAATLNPRVREMLDELPADAAPACPYPEVAPHGFTTHNRFIRPMDQAYVGSPGCEGLSFHGLDYMLLHNLYAIATPGTWMGSPDADPCEGLPEPGTDAGVGQDAGVPLPDAGAVPPGDPSGCDCALGPGTGGARTPRLFALAALGLLLLRRRVRAG